MNVGLSGRFAEFAAAVHEPGQVVLIFGTPAEVDEARTRLARVGVESVAGAVTAPDALVANPHLVTTASRLTALQAAERIEAIDDLQVVDVRGPGEFAAGALPKAVNLPLQRLRNELQALDPGRPVLVTCAGGYRSIAAASMLEAHGFADVSDRMGGWGAWQAERTPAPSQVTG